MGLRMGIVLSMGRASARVSVEIERQVAWLQAALEALGAALPRIRAELEVEIDHRLGLLALLAPRRR